MSKTERLFHPRTLVIHPDFKNLEEFIVFWFVYAEATFPVF